MFAQENALSPESRHSNGSAVGMGANGSPVVSFAYGGAGPGQSCNEDSQKIFF